MSTITDLFNEMTRLNVLNGTIRFNVVHTDIDVNSIAQYAALRDRYNKMLMFQHNMYFDIHVILKLEGRTIEDFDFSTIADFVDQIVIINCTVINCDFTNVQLYNCNVNNSTFSNCNFTECNLDGCEGGTCDIDNNTFDNCRLDYDMYNLLINTTYTMQRQFTSFITENRPHTDGRVYAKDTIYTVYAQQVYIPAFAH